MRNILVWLVFLLSTSILPGGLIWALIHFDQGENAAAGGGILALMLWIMNWEISRGVFEFFDID